MMHSMTKCAASAIMASLLLFSAADALAQGNGPQTRVINLEPISPDPLHNNRSDLPNGTVKLNNYAGNWPNEYRISVTGLSPLFGDEFYSIYITLQESVENYISGEFGNSRIIFNVNDSGSWSAFMIDSDRVSGYPSITAFVVRERDDGDEFDPAIDLADVILQGTSYLP